MLEFAGKTDVGVRGGENEDSIGWNMERKMWLVADGMGGYACGEVACVSVHGANRLGGNSLLDLVVFGRASGLFIEKQLRDGIEHRDATDADLEFALSRLNKLNTSTGGENAAELREELQSIMQNHFGVFRRGDFMKQGIEKLAALRIRMDNIELAVKYFFTQVITCC